MSSRSKSLKERWDRLGNKAMASSKERKCRHCKVSFVIGFGNQLFCDSCRSQCFDEFGNVDGVKMSRLTTYGLLPKDFDRMWFGQQGRCSLCDNELTFGKRGKSCLHVDHDHATGKVRGLLCRSCNNSLGFIERGEDWLQRALAYLKHHKEN